VAKEAAVTVVDLLVAVQVATKEVARVGFSVAMAVGAGATVVAAAKEGGAAEMEAVAGTALVAKDPVVVEEGMVDMEGAMVKPKAVAPMVERVQKEVAKRVGAS
jgi:hypothetical protein